MNSIKIGVLIFIIAHLLNNPKEKKYNIANFFFGFRGRGGVNAKPRSGSGHILTLLYLVFILEWKS